MFRTVAFLYNALDSSVSLPKNIREGHETPYRVRCSFPCPRYECTRMWKWGVDPLSLNLDSKHRSAVGFMSRVKCHRCPSSGRLCGRQSQPERFGG